MSRKVGVVAVALQADQSKFMADMDAARGKVRDFGEGVRKFSSELRPPLHEAALAFDAITLAANKGKESVLSLRAAGREFLEFGAAALVAAKGVAVYGAHSEELVNTYRALRLAFSPTLFTAGTLAAGLAVEETLRLVNARAKLVEQDSLVAAQENRLFSSISTYSTAGRISGQGGAIYSTLGALSPSELLVAIDRIKALKDPLDRAREAVKTFGAEGAAALPLLNDNLKLTVERSFEMAEQMNGPTRESLQRMRDAISDVGGMFHGIADDFRYLQEASKQEIVLKISSVERFIHDNTQEGTVGGKALDNIGKIEAGPLARLAGEKLAADYQLAHPAEGISDPQFKAELEETLKGIHAAPGVPGTRAYGPLLPGQVDRSVGSRAGAVADEAAYAKHADSLGNIQSELSAAKARIAKLVESHSLALAKNGDTSLLDGQLAAETKRADLLEMRVKQMERFKSYSEKMGTVTQLDNDYAGEGGARPWILKRRPSLYGPGQPGSMQDFGVQPSTFVSNEADRTAATAGTTAAEQDRLKAYGEGLLGHSKTEDELDKLNLQIEGMKRLTTAQIEGAEAVRKAQLDNKYEQMAADKINSKVIDATRIEDEAQHQREISAEANKRVTIFADQLEILEQQRDVIVDQIAQGKATVDQARALRDIENERLKVLVQQDLAVGSAMAGVRAFFTEMQEGAKQSSEIVYESLKSALDRSSNEFAKFLTGQKTSFGKMFQGIGESIVQSTVKSAAQQGIGALGKILTKQGAQKPQSTLGKLGGILGTVLHPPGAPGALGKPDGSSETAALFVRIVGGACCTGGAGSPSGVAGPGNSSGDAPGSPSGGAGSPWESVTSTFSPMVQKQKKKKSFWDDMLPMLDGFLGAMGGGAGGGAGAAGGGADAAGGAADASDGLTEVVSSSFEALAGGGEVYPGTAYTVGERGSETFVPHSRGTIIPHGGMGGDSHYYNINVGAGMDPAIYAQRTEAAIRAAHQDSIVKSIQAGHDQMRRTPSK